MTGLDLLMGPAFLALLFIAWLAVQRLWGRVFDLPPHADMLAERGSCASCSRSKTCRSRSKTIVVVEDHHG
jgi:hypothetical protein